MKCKDAQIWQSFFAQLKQFEFRAKIEMGISATPGLWLAPKSSQVGLRLSADPVGIINDPQKDLCPQAEEKEKSWKFICAKKVELKLGDKDFKSALLIILRL